jgi:hypothetical protein
MEEAKPRPLALPLFIAQVARLSRNDYGGWTCTGSVDAKLGLFLTAFT